MKSTLIVLPLKRISETFKLKKTFQRIVIVILVTSLSQTMITSHINVAKPTTSLTALKFKEFCEMLITEIAIVF